MMTDERMALPKIQAVYGTLPSMLKKFDKYARKDRFSGHTAGEFEAWRGQIRKLLRELLGFDKMEKSSLRPVVEEVTILPGSIRREHVRIQVEPDVWMPFYLLIPGDASSHTRPFLCPPGHNGAGKYTVAGVKGYAAVEEKIRQYQYDYGMQLAELGYVAVCPDCRGFGERREEIEDTKEPFTALGGGNACLGSDQGSGLCQGTGRVGHGQHKLSGIFGRRDADFMAVRPGRQGKAGGCQRISVRLPGFPSYFKQKLFLQLCASFVGAS